ncbi:hypothetical protein DRN86_04355 [Candidatus Geothermarchaeota archaeon]|nr:MAG: hypothetical protein DRN86_04355 [Candidatus Geothermarchaeota archaeon]
MANYRNNQIEDIFAETDKEKKPATPRARAGQPTVQGKKARPTPVPLSVQPAGASGVVKKSRTPLVIILVIIVVVGAGVVLWQSDIFFDKETANAPSTTVTVNTTLTTTVDTRVVNRQTVELPTVNTAVADTDGDGLSDEVEKELGTKVNHKDTDNDQLFDREEVMVYKTNPLQGDTDGDGIMDGVEVANGYDPNGPGKLLDLQNEIEKLP